MAGKQGRSGRLSDLTLVDGADGVLQMPVAAQVAKPALASPEASAKWDLFMAEAGHRIKREDAPLLQMACETWALYVAAHACAHRNPTDKDSRIAVTSYLAKFEQLCARFGFNPADRQRLKAPAPKQGVRRRQA